MYRSILRRRAAECGRHVNASVSNVDSDTVTLVGLTQ
jgi:hypothetical protein